MVDKFFTVEETVIEKEIIEKKSRFIARIMRVNSEKEATEKINEIKKEFRDARHHVFAYRLANGNERFSDDGEPSGTAGVPILDILRGEKIENVLVVVTRYFGGILLGTGGLVKAYSGAAKEAILASPKVEMRLCTEYKITIDYNYYDILNHYLRKNEIIIKNVDYSEKINVFVIVEKSTSEKVLKEIEEITDRTFASNIIDTYYYI